MPPTPKSWPSNLPYLSAPIHSQGLTETHHCALTRNLGTHEELNAAQTPNHSPLVKIVPIEQSSHPACGQSGLFATRHLKPGTFILLYLGLVHSGRPDQNENFSESDYDLWLDRNDDLAVDAANCGNEARFINDYRGVAERPNAEFKEVWSQKHKQRCMAVYVLPVGKFKGKNCEGKGGVGKGQEILISYGKGFWSHRLHSTAGEAP